MGDSVRVQGTVPAELYDRAKEECPALADDDSALLVYVMQSFVDDRDLERRRAEAPLYPNPPNE